MTKMIGTVNGYSNSKAWIGSKEINFDGTTLGLTRSAILAGAKEGTKILANFGGRMKSNASKMVIVAAPHDERAFGYWAR